MGSGTQRHAPEPVVVVAAAAAVPAAAGSVAATGGERRRGGGQNWCGCNMVVLLRCRRGGGCRLQEMGVRAAG